MTNLQIPIIIQATNRSSLFASKVLAPLTDDLTVLAYLVRGYKTLGWIRFCWPPATTLWMIPWP